MEELKPQAISRYTSIVASIANEALKKVDGVTKEDGIVKNRLGFNSLKTPTAMSILTIMVWLASIWLSM